MMLIWYDHQKKSWFFCFTIYFIRINIDYYHTDTQKNTENFSFCVLDDHEWMIVERKFEEEEEKEMTNVQIYKVQFGVTLSNDDVDVQKDKKKSHIHIKTRI